MKVPSLPSAVQPYVSTVQASWKRMLPYWISAALTALVSILFARAFGWSEKLAFSWFETNPAWAFLIIPVGMLASTKMAQLFAPAANGSGIPQLLAAVEVSREANPILERLLGLRIIVVKFLGACVCVAGGGVTGREGPMLQIAGSIFYNVHKLWHKTETKLGTQHLQPMILAGGAAGLASAFNTPLGGIIFAIEELAKTHISHIRTYVFHAVIIAGLLAQAVLGNYHYFGKWGMDTPPVFEIILLVVASALIGIFGALFGSAVVASMDLRSRISKHQQTLLTLGLGLIVATIAYFYGKMTLGSGRDVILDLASHPDQQAPFALGFVRAFGNFFTYAGGVIGGVFAPALSTGAAFGSWMSSWNADFHHQVWMLAGMAAFLTGVTRTPFTSMILVLEMTDSHDVIICLMLAVIIAQSASKFVDPVSFYEHMSYRIIHGKAPGKGASVHTAE